MIAKEACWALDARRADKGQVAYSDWPDAGCRAYREPQTWQEKLFLYESGHAGERGRLRTSS